MLIPGALAASLVLVPKRWREVLVVGAIAVLPTATAVGVLVVLVLLGRRGAGEPYDEVVFLNGVASELRSGNSLRQAIALASKRVPALPLVEAVDLALGGAPISDVAAALEAALPIAGPVAAATVVIGSETGGNLSAAFGAASAAVGSEIDVARETSTATAAVRASLVVVGGLGVLALVFAVGSGGIERLVAAGSFGVAVAVAGVSLMIAGLVASLALGRASVA